MRRTTALVSAALLAAASGSATAERQPAPSSLQAEIARADAEMFEAFNAHDLDRAMGWFARDLEFYHDKNGLVSYDGVKEGYRGLFAQDNGMRRELVSGSLEVYPVKDFGAIEVGRHRFCHIEGGRNECGTFKFTMVWRKQNGKWQVTRALSYDHK